jgi:hypothetical protein
MLYSHVQLLQMLLCTVVSGGNSMQARLGDNVGGISLHGVNMPKEL